MTSTVDSDGRIHKKRRTHIADGFLTDKKPRQPVSVPKFTSGFDDCSSGSDVFGSNANGGTAAKRSRLYESTEIQKRKSSSSSTTRTNLVAATRTPVVPVEAKAPQEHQPEHKPSGMRPGLNPTKAFLHDFQPARIQAQNQNKPSSHSHPPPFSSATRFLPNHAQLLATKIAKPKPSSQSRPLEFNAPPSFKQPSTQLAPARPPPWLPLDSAPSTSTSAVLRPCPPPPAPPSTKPVSKKVLKPLPVPELPGAEAEAKDLRSISETRVALATNISTGSGIAELASIFLSDQHQNPEIRDPSLGSNVEMRGMGISPEKKGKNKNPRYLRGGLAARASSFYQGSQTQLVMWQRETERRANAHSSSSSFRASIIRIIHQPLPLATGTSTSKTPPLAPGIALCHIQKSSHFPQFKSNELYRIVLSFNPSPSYTPLFDPVQFAEGRSICVFHPWQEVSFSSTPSPRLPASLPLPSSDPSNPLDFPINDLAILCSRFMIL